MQESVKNAKKSENAGEKLAFFTLDLTGKSLSKRTWCQAPFWRSAVFPLLSLARAKNRHPCRFLALDFVCDKLHLSVYDG
jgi:hypothetical protein